MQLCDKDILQAIISGELLFVGAEPNYPFKKEQIQPASVDLRLGNRIMRFKRDVDYFDIQDKEKISQYMETEYIADGDQITIRPGEILYGQIYEQLVIGEKFSARIEGRSRVARLGISVHCTGDYINPGFAGAMPLQIINHNHFPVIIYPFIGICQIMIYRLSNNPLVSYLERIKLPYNEYYGETNPGPSILSANPVEGLTNDHIIEKKIHNLIENYYNTVLKDHGAASDSGQRIPSEGSYKTVIERATIENLHLGGYSMRDQYNARQVGIQGPNAGGGSTIYQGYYEGEEIDITQLMSELDTVKEHLKKQPENTENDILVGEVAKAKQALSQNDKPQALEILKACGSKLYDIVKSIGCSLIAKYLAGQLHIS